MTRAGRLTRSQVAALPVASPAELLLAEQLRQAGIPFEREFLFAPEDWCRANGFLSPVRQLPRKWRADFLVKDSWLNPWLGQYRDTVGRPFLIEVEGGGWVNGRHSRGAGMEADCEKSALAAIRGYRVMRVTPAQVNDGRALAWIKQALGLEAA